MAAVLTSAELVQSACTFVLTDIVLYGLFITQRWKDQKFHFEAQNFGFFIAVFCNRIARGRAYLFLQSTKPFANHFMGFGTIAPALIYIRS